MASRETGRGVAAAACSLLVLLLVGDPAVGHTGFESSEPGDGAETFEPVDLITLVFTGEAEPSGDGFVVLDGDGTV